VIWLVGAQTMSLFQAAGIILWANIGTTLTAWFVALWGFKINIAILALPFVGLGWLTAVISKKHSSWRGRAIFLLGFGMILLWLSYMKDSFAYIQNVIDLGAYHNLPTLFFLFFSIWLTILVQSSTVATTIILAAMYAHAITFDAGLAMIVGANIGTTFTAILWSLWGIAKQKQIAAFHVLFNIITWTIIYLSLPIWDWLLVDVLKFTDPVVALAAFHSLFSIFGVILFVPVLWKFLSYIEKIFPENWNFLDRYPRLKKLFVHDVSI
jgi:phosphate:Na+ symporter